MDKYACHCIDKYACHCIDKYACHCMDKYACHCIDKNSCHRLSETPAVVCIKQCAKITEWDGLFIIGIGVRGLSIKCSASLR